MMEIKWRANKNYRTMCFILPRYTLSRNTLTRKHILFFFNKFIPAIREYYLNVNAQQIVFKAVLTIPAKKGPNCLTLLSKRTKPHAWNKLKLYKKAPFQRVFSAKKLNEQFSNVHQYKR